MSKFKNKKALILAISAAMAGVGIIGAAAACAPTKAKKRPADEEAKKQATKALEDKKTAAKAEITNLTDLTEEERTNFNSKVDAIVDTTKLDEVEKVLADAKAKNEENKKAKADEEAKKQATKALEDKKTAAKAEITNLTDLTEEERTNFNSKVDAIVDTTKLDEVEKVLADAKAKNEENKKAKADEEAKKQATKALEDKKTAVKSEIAKLTDLTEEEKTNFNSKVDAIVDTTKLDEVEKVLADAKAKNEENKKAKADEEAKKQATKALEDKKTAVKSEIAKLTDLTEEEKTNFNSKVDAIVDTTKLDEVEKVLADAKAKNEENKKAKAGEQESATNA